MSANRQRRHYIVAYDIADDRRRNEVFRTLHAFGDHAQYSVFFCELNQQELVLLRTRLREAINQKLDQILIVDLGPAARSLDEGLEVLGKGYEASTRTVVV